MNQLFFITFIIIISTFYHSNSQKISYKNTTNKQWSARIVGDQCVTAKNQYILVQHCQQELSIQLIYNPKTNNSIITEANDKQLNISKYWKFDSQEIANKISASINENKIFIMRECRKIMIYQFDMEQEKIDLYINITLQSEFCGGIQSIPSGVIISDNNNNQSYIINNSLIFSSNQLTIQQQDIILIQSFQNINSIGRGYQGDTLIVSSNCNIYKTTLNLDIIDQYSLIDYCQCDQSIRIDSQNEQGTLFSIGCFNPSNTQEWRYILLNNQYDEDDNIFNLVTIIPDQDIIESSTAISTYKDSTYYITSSKPSNIDIWLIFEGIKNSKFRVQYTTSIYYNKKNSEKSQIHLDYVYNQQLKSLILIFQKNDTLTIPLCNFKYYRFNQFKQICELCPDDTTSQGIQTLQCINCKTTYKYIFGQYIKLSETLYCIKPNCQYASSLKYTPTYNETYFLNNDNVCESVCSGPQMLRKNKTCQYKCDYNCIECQARNSICSYTPSGCKFDNNSLYQNSWDNTQYLNCPNVQGNYSYTPTNDDSLCNIIEFNNQSTLSLLPTYIDTQEQTILCRKEFQIKNLNSIQIYSRINSLRPYLESLTLFIDQNDMQIQINNPFQSLLLNPLITTNLTILYSVKPGGSIEGFNISFLKGTTDINPTQIFCSEISRCLDCVFANDNFCVWDLNRKTCQSGNKQQQQVYYINYTTYSECPINCETTSINDTDTDLNIFFKVFLKQNQASNKCLLYEYRTNFIQETRIIVQLASAYNSNGNNRLLQSYYTEQIIMTIQNKQSVIGTRAESFSIPPGNQRILFSYYTDRKSTVNFTRNLIIKPSNEQIKYIKSSPDQIEPNNTIFIVVFILAGFFIICCMVIFVIFIRSNFNKRRNNQVIDPFQDIELVPIKIAQREAEECPICLGTLKENSYLYFPCKRHLVHLDCLKTWVLQNGNSGINKYCIFRCETVQNSEQVFLQTN